MITHQLKQAIHERLRNLSRKNPESVRVYKALSYLLDRQDRSLRDCLRIGNEIQKKINLRTLPLPLALIANSKL